MVRRRRALCLVTREAGASASEDARVKGPAAAAAVMRAAAVALPLLASGCSDDKPATVAGDVNSEQNLKRDCADPKWRDQNLGLWYSLCRQPLRW